MKIALRALEKKLDAARVLPPNPSVENMVKNLEERLKRASSEEKDEIQAKLTNLQRMLKPQQPKLALSNEERKALQEEIGTLKPQIRAIDKFKPITTTLIVEYLKNNNLVTLDEEGWWQDHFSADPTTEEDATLTHAGAKKLLIQMGYVAVS